MGNEVNKQKAQKRVLDILNSIQPKLWKGSEYKDSVTLIQEARNARAEQISKAARDR